jgi:hypothetical protein
MIVYGTNSKLLKQAPLENQDCSHCHEKDMQLLIYSSYVHIFWIPFFPYKKKAVLHCTHCQQVTEEKDISEEKKTLFKALKSSVSTPKYLFSGLAVLAILIVWLNYKSRESERNELDYLKDPKIGDVYKLVDETELTEYKYYLWKVVDVKPDSLYVSASSFTYNGVPDELEPEDGFYDIYYSINKDLISEMYDKKEVKEIIREYDESTGFNRLIPYLLDSTQYNNEILE